MMTISKQDCPPTMFSISDLVIIMHPGAVSPPVITMQTVTDSLGVWSNVTLICEASGFPAPAFITIYGEMVIIYIATCIGSLFSFSLFSKK